jgi:DUF4097 and DUF4098 domain-containing protein YvlB
VTVKAREILLALFIIAVGVIAHYVQSGNLDPFFGGEAFLRIAGEEFVFEETLEIPAPLPEFLDVQNAHGGVDVRADAADRITVVFRKSVRHRTREQAAAVAGALKMTVRREGGRLVLATNRETFKRQSFETFFTVSLPAGTPVKIRNSYGPVKVSGSGTAEIENPHGEVRAENIGGALVLANSYESVLVRNAAADVRLDCPHSELTIEGVRGGALIDHRYGEIALRDVAGAVVVRGSHSKVTGSALPGTVEIESSYEDISLSETGPVTIRGPHCGIDVKTAAGPVAITGRYGRIDARGIRGNLKIDAPNSEVAASDVRAEVIDIKTTGQNVALIGFTGQTKLQMGHGELRLEPLDFSGSIDVEAVYSDIDLAWPSGLRAPFEGLSKGGRIVWNLPDRPDVDEADGSSLLKAFQSETGRPGIRLSTSHGDIRVEGRAAIR